MRPRVVFYAHLGRRYLRSPQLYVLATPTVAVVIEGEDARRVSSDFVDIGKSGNVALLIEPRRVQSGCDESGADMDEESSSGDTELGPLLER